MQNGVKMKAEMMATGYGQQLLDEPSSAQIGPDVLFTQGWAPVEAKTKATKLLQADLKKYADFTGVPDFGIYTGYTDCDLTITGLKQQGKNLDPTTFADGIRKLGQVNPADLSCQPLDFSDASFGQPAPTTCSYAMHVKNGKFVILKPKGGSDAVLDREAGRSVGHGAHHHTHDIVAPFGRGGRTVDQSEASKALMWRITEEIWNQNHPELIAELIAEDLVDHVDLPGLDGTGRSRYRASVELDARRVSRLPESARLRVGRWRVRSLVRSHDRHAHGRVHGHPADRTRLRCPDLRHPSM